MEDIERLLKGTVEELERLLSAKNVLGTPIEKDGVTVIPLVSYGFGFGAGGGVEPKNGRNGGTGGGGGIKPVGAIIIDKDGVRVESVKTTMTNLVEVLSAAAAKAMDRSAAREDQSAD